MVFTGRAAQKRKRKLLLLLALITSEEETQQRRYIRTIVRKRTVNGEYFLLPDLKNDPHYHQTYFRMTKESFEQLLLQIEPEISHAVTHLCPIPIPLRLAITLRYLATGASQKHLALSYRVSPSSVGNILRETMTAIIKILEPLYLPTPTHETWKQSEKIFREKWNFPFCVGAIDGKHVRIRSPWKSGTMYHNYKGFFSQILLAVVGGDYRFLVVDIGAPGSESDGAVFAKSTLYKKMVRKTLMLPENETIGNTAQDVPYLFVGDEAFPLKPWLMRPFPGKELDLKRRVFNYRLSRARRVVENAFGIWAARWRILFSSIDGDADLVHLIIRATIILHNFLREVKDRQVFEDNNETQGNWRDEFGQCFGVQDIPRVGSNNYGLESYNVRETFMNYFSSEEGKLEGQEAYVMRS